MSFVETERIYYMKKRLIITKPRQSGCMPNILTKQYSSDQQNRDENFRNMYKGTMVLNMTLQIFEKVMPNLQGIYNCMVAWIIHWTVDASKHVRTIKSNHKQSAHIFVGVIFCIISICQYWPLVDNANGCRAFVPDWNIRPWQLYDGSMAKVCCRKIAWLYMTLWLSN